MIHCYVGDEGEWLDVEKSDKQDAASGQPLPHIDESNLPEHLPVHNQSGFD